MGFSDKTIDITDTTRPLTLFRDVHLMGGWFVEVRRKFTSHRWAFLGAFQDLHTFRVADITIYGNNPYNSPKNSTASVYLSGFRDYFSEWRITQDTSPNSFLDGMSKIGGISGAVSGILALIFGWGLVEAAGFGNFALFRRLNKRTPQVPNDQKFGVVNQDLEKGDESIRKEAHGIP